MTVVISGTNGVSGVAGSASTPSLVGSDADSGFYINSANEPNASVNGTAVWNAASTFGFKNRLINGGMTIDQRNAGASITPSVNPTYGLDRWENRFSVASKYSVVQSSTAPAGFVNSMLYTSTSAYSVGASETFYFNQKIEGFNCADLGWGTANAKTVTLSFWVRSSLTGTFGGAIKNSDSTRNYAFSYTISAADTWEYKTVTIAGDTTGTWLTTNGTGIRVVFSLGSGSNQSTTAGSWGSDSIFSATGAVSVVGTNGATFYITGVQLEKGSTATSFDFRSYGTELALCQRYLPCFNATSTGAKVGIGFAGSTTQTYVYYQFPVTTRVPPTGISVSSVSNFTVNPYTGTGGTATLIAFVDAGVQECRIQANSTGLVAGAGMELTPNTSSATQIQFTGCEL